MTELTIVQCELHWASRHCYDAEERPEPKCQRPLSEKDSGILNDRNWPEPT
jgi:hypothetical protein